MRAGSYDSMSSYFNWKQIDIRVLLHSELEYTNFPNWYFEFACHLLDLSSIQQLLPLFVRRDSWKKKSTIALTFFFFPELPVPGRCTFEMCMFQLGMSHAVDDSERQSILQGEASTTAPKAPDAPDHFKAPQHKPQSKYACSNLGVTPKGSTKGNTR